MARPYAGGTTVTEARSHFELQSLLKKYGCLETGWMDQGGRNSLIFSRDNVTYRFSVDLPQDDAEIKVDRNYRASKHGTRAEYERSRKMRALIAVVKAQLVAVDEGIIRFDEIFIGQAVTDNGQTVAERWAPEVQRKALEGTFPSSLPGGSR